VARRDRRSAWPGRASGLPIDKLGEDLTLTNTGGGNTSSKLEERDPLTSEPVEVLWIKGSGGDLRTHHPGRAGVALPRQGARHEVALPAQPGPGPEDQGRGRHVPDVRPLRVQPEPARVLDRHTAAHAGAYKHVDHLHPNAVIALAASVNQRRLTAEVYGDEVFYVPWQRPGFDIGLGIEDAIRAWPTRRAACSGIMA